MLVFCCSPEERAALEEAAELRVGSKVKRGKGGKLEEEKATGWEGEKWTSHKRPLGGNEGGREEEESPGGRLGSYGDSVVERSRGREVSLVKAEPVRRAWTLFQRRSQAVLGQGSVLEGVGEEDVKEPAFQHRSRDCFSRAAASDATSVGKRSQVDDDDKEDGEEDADGDRGEVGCLPDWHQAAGLGEGAALTLHQLHRQGGGGTGHLHLVLNPRQDLLQRVQLLGAIAGPWVVGKSKGGRVRWVEAEARQLVPLEA